MRSASGPHSLGRPEVPPTGTGAAVRKKLRERRIPGLRGLSPWAILKASVQEFAADDMSTYAAALSYQVLFSIFPFIIFLVALVGFLHVPQFFNWLRTQAALFLPDQAMSQVNQVITQLEEPQGGLLSVGVIVAIWSASAGVRAMMNALNRAYGVKEGRPWWKLYPLSIVFTVGLAIVLLAAAAMFVLGPQVVQWIANHVGIEQYLVELWKWLRWPVMVLLLTFAAATVYYVAPDVEQEFRFITPGAMLSVVVWLLASVGFDYYVRTFANYNKTYGSIGTIVVLLLYFFLTAAVMLFGAEINAVIEHHSPDGKDPGEKTLPPSSD
ncbi:YihY/virulence factor BrkB family protein [Oxalobacteraceae bacterium OM1]|nr:YihY/virulence factor BrkB family protein [Oxalobacteraceae bacterium OM1]